MKANSKILITGGSSGIGLEMARQFTALGHRVVICGRDEGRLAEARSNLPEIDTFACDISDPKQREALYQWIVRVHPDCNVLVNNAAIVFRTSFLEDQEAFLKIQTEFEVNCLAPIALIKRMLPDLEKIPGSEIVTITTGLVYAPKAEYPGYNATKAALHSFLQGLRYTLSKKNYPVRITEVLMPAVDTPWHGGNPPAIAISPQRAVKEMMQKLNKGKEEIRVGKVKILYWIARLSPGLAMNIVNRS